MSYYLADSRDGDLMLWRDNGDDVPTAIMGDYECSDETWQLLLRGAGLDPDTVCVSRRDLAEVLWHAHITPTHAAEAAVRLWTASDDWQGVLASCPDQEASP